MRRPFLLLLAPFVLVACGGQVDSVDGKNDPNQNTSTNPNNKNLPNTVIGSFDLTFVSVVVTSPNPGQSPATQSSPSQNANARLDVEKIPDDLGSYAAAVTPRWGITNELAPTLSASLLALDKGYVAFSLPAPNAGSNVSDHWTSIDLGRTANGGFDGTFTATGSEEVSEGDEVFEYDLAAKGTIANDVTAPETRTTVVSSSGPPNALLPWDSITAQIAEPIADDSNRKSFSVSPLPNGAAATFQSSGEESDGVAGTTTFHGYLSDWTGVGGTQATLSVGAVLDPSGNASAPLTAPISFFDVGAARAAFTFGGGVAPMSSWDTTGNSIGFLGGDSPDATCESGACAKIGPIDGQRCTPFPFGLAGILAGSKISTLHVRYRILVGPSANATGGPQLVSQPQLVAIQTASPGGAPVSTTFGFATTDLKTISPVLGMSQGTDWTTFDVPLNAPATTVGFAVRFGDSNFCGGPLFNSDAALVLIDSVTAD